MSAKRPVQERKSKRLKVFEPAVIVQGPRESRAHLLDISKAGAAVHCEGAAQVGETVTIHCGAMQLSGRIIWTQGHRLGVAFGAPIGEAVMAALLRSIAPGAKA